MACIVADVACPIRIPGFASSCLIRVLEQKQDPPFSTFCCRFRFAGIRTDTLDTAVDGQIVLEITFLMV
jgi:hypothetical protein